MRRRDLHQTGHRLHLSKNGAKGGEDKPDEAFHTEVISSHGSWRGNYYSPGVVERVGPNALQRVVCKPTR